MEGHQITIAHAAYCKMMLHALKFPHAGVHGALLGRRSGSALEIVDALPMFHSQTVAASLLQAAFTQVPIPPRRTAERRAVMFARIASQADAHSVTLDCEVCGCYTANEREVDNELNALAKAVGGKVATNCGQAWCVAHTSVGAPS